MKVTLSFDNGPTETTREVLDVLAQREIRASFFVVGTQLAEPGMRRYTERAAEEGHWIGNHTLTHTVQFGDSADPGLPHREIGSAQDLIGDLAHRDKLFRPFGGGGILDRRLLSSPAIDYLQNHAYTCVLWNCIPHDWDRPDDWVETCLTDIATRPWSLVVIHDLPTGAMTHLPRFLDALESLGAEVAQDFPESCVPMRNGVVTGSLDHLTA
ncbi:MAG: polysaccharide deacetylase family protein [Nocardiaceae bacterium]|nr:polysaccharide deacetylase family protein [Nocardiaceae bacterium]